MTKKAFTIDTTSEEECLQMINLMKSCLGEIRLARGGLTKVQQHRNVFDACVAILETDISNLYDGLNLDSTKKYYVYAHLDTRRKIAVNANGKTTFAASLGMDYFPFYIGKGTGARASEINRNETHRKVREQMKRLGFEPKVFVIKDGLTEVEALSLESKLIDIFGLVSNKGRLTNLDEGVKKDERHRLYQQHLAVISQLHRNSV